MKVEFDYHLVRKLREAGISHKEFLERDSDYHEVHLEPCDLVKKDRELLEKVVKEGGNRHDNKAYKALLRECKAAWAVEGKGSEEGKIKTLEMLAAAINKLIPKVPRRWVFDRDPTYGYPMPYFLEKAVFHPADTRRDYYHPAYTEIRAIAVCRGKKTSTRETFYRNDLAGHPTVEAVLAKRGWFFATTELMADYDQDFVNYKRWHTQIGEQFSAVGIGVSDDEDKWAKDEMALEVEGSSSKLVMDDAIGYGTDSALITDVLGQDAEEDEDEEPPLSSDDDDDEEDDPVMARRRRKKLLEKAALSQSEAEAQVQKEVRKKLPTHLIVRMFDLRTHSFLNVHVGDIAPYSYNADLINKLVLPDEHKELIGALTNTALTRYSDIISGKAMGVIVLCSGTPGTGKTLTAEVYSEVAKRPLYLVQCSQLGTDAEEMETSLLEVLKRAERWRAILLIDEADVYIHERGDDINQNAIVGVFLRVLEYFKGILFLTTNRATVVDDAIISRMTAHIRYKVPEGEDRQRLWDILSAQYKVPMSREMLDKAVEKFPKISGRSIRQILRLAKFMADQKAGGRVNMASLVSAAKFHNFSDDEAMSDKEVTDVEAYR